MKLEGRTCKCGGCGQSFRSASSFESHRTGEYSLQGRVCLTFDQMRAQGMAQDSRGTWMGACGVCMSPKQTTSTETNTSGRGTSVIALDS